jgi:hypothetical protein
MKSKYNNLAEAAPPGSLRVQYPIHGMQYKLVVNGGVLSVADSNGVFAEYTDPKHTSLREAFNGDTLLFARCDDVCIKSPVPVPTLLLHGRMYEAAQ